MLKIFKEEEKNQISNNLYMESNIITVQWNTTLLLPQIDPGFQAVHPLKVTFHCREFTLSRYRSVGSMVCAELVIIMFTTALEGSIGLQWTSELEAGSCGAMPVCLTFFCTLRLSITPMLLWLTDWTDSTLWFYGERMWTLCGLLLPLSVSHWTVSLEYPTVLGCFFWI